MALFKDIPIRNKLQRGISLIIGVVLLVTTSAFFSYELFKYRQTAIEKLSTIGRIIATNGSAAVAFYNEKDAMEILSSLKSEPEIVAACFYDKDGNIFAHYPAGPGPAIFPNKPGPPGYHYSFRHLEGFEPVVEGNNRLGTLYLQYNLADMFERIMLYGILVAVVVMASFFLTHLLSRILQKNIASPVLALAETAKGISDKKDYSVRAVKMGKDEVGLLTDSFNQMLGQIQAQDFSLKAFKNRMESQTRALQHIVAENLKTGSSNLPAAINGILKAASETLNTERASVWLYDQFGSSIKCIDLFEKDKNTHTEGAILFARDIPEYFKAIKSDRVVKIDDAVTDPRTSGLSAMYLKPLGISSMLDAPIRKAGQSVGIVCFEHVGPMRVWTLDEQLFAGAVADSIAILFESGERISAEKSLREKERQLSAIYDTVGDMLLSLSVEKDGRFKFTSINKACEIFSGLSYDQVVGKYVEDIINQPWLNPVLEKCREAVRERKVVRFEEVLGSPSKRLSGEVNIAPLFEDNGGGSLLIMSIHDVTERKNAEQKIRNLNTELEVKVKNRTTELESANSDLKLHAKQLKEREAELSQTNKFLDLILENIPNMVFVKDVHNLRFVRFNRAGERLLGYSRQFLIGKSDHELFSKEQADFFVAKDREAISGGGTLDIPEEPMDTQSGKRWLHTQKLAVTDEENKPLFLLGISEDITERKKSNEVLEQKSRDLARSNKDLEQFAYVASHDLQEPLRMVSSFLQLLEKHLGTNLDKEAKEFIGFAVDGANRMKGMIDDLLSYSRVLTRKPEFVSTDIGIIVQDAITNLKESIAETNAKIEVGKMPVAAVDKVKATRIFQNLISNAIKFQPKDVAPVVEINSTEEHDQYTFSVKDNGIGIPKEQQDKLFVIFQRLHSKQEYPGTGIGLAECKKIAELHGGRIWVESDIGKGSTFYFTIRKSLENQNSEIKNQA